MEHKNTSVKYNLVYVKIQHRTLYNIVDDNRTHGKNLCFVELVSFSVLSFYLFSLVFAQTTKKGKQNPYLKVITPIKIDSLLTI